MKRALVSILLVSFIILDSLAVHGVLSIRSFIGNSNAIGKEGSVGRILALEDIGVIRPHDMSVEKGNVLEGNLYSIYSSDSKIVIGSDSGIISITFVFKIGGSGVLTLFAVRSDSASISVYYYSYLTNDYNYAGSGSNLFTITLPERAIDNYGRLLIKIKLVAASNFNLTIYDLSFDPSVRTKYIPYRVTGSDGSQVVEIEYTPRVLPATIIFRNLSRLWKFIWCNKEIVWDYSLPGFTATELDTYKLFFSVINYWDYEDREMSKIDILDYNGKPINIDKLNITYRGIKYSLNSSKWIYKRTYLVKNPLNIDLYNVSATVILNYTNFNFLAVNPNLSDIMFVYMGKITPHRITYWDGRKAVIAVKLEKLNASTTSKLEMFYGNENEKNLNVGQLGFYNVSFNSSTQLNDWLKLNGNWDVKQIPSLNKYFLHGYPGQDRPFAVFNHFLPPQVNVSVVFYVNTTPTEVDFTISQDPNYNDYYFFRVLVLDDLPGNYQLLAALYRNNSGTVVQLTSYSSTIIYSPQRLFRVSYVITDTFTSICIGNSIFNSYTFGSPLGGDIRLGFTGNDSDIYIGNLIINNYYDGYVEASGPLNDSINNIVKEYYEPKRLYREDVFVRGFDSILVEIRDTFGNNVLNVEENISEYISIKTDLVPIEIKASEGFQLATITAIDGNRTFSAILRPLDEEILYVKYGESLFLNVSYKNTGNWFSLNLSISKPEVLYLTGLALNDLLNFMERHDRNMKNNNTEAVNLINNLEVKVDAIHYELLGKISGLENDSSIIYNKTLMIINLQEVLLGNFSLIKTNLTEISKDIVNINTNLTEIIDHLLTLTNLTSVNNQTITEVLNNISSISEALNRIIETVVIINQTNYNISNYVRILIDLYNQVNESIGYLGVSVNTIINNTEGLFSRINETTITLYRALNESIITLNYLVSQENLTYSQIIDSLESITNLTNNISKWTIVLNNSMVDLTEITVMNLNVSKNILNLLQSINRNITAKLDLIIRLVNDTLYIRIKDDLLGLKQTFEYQLENTTGRLLDAIRLLQETLLSKLRIRTVRLVDSKTGQVLESDMIFVKIGSEKIYSGTILVASSVENIEVLDYWGRKLPYNISDSLFMDIYVDVGKVYIANNLLENIYVKIRPTEILDKTYDFIIGGINYIELFLPVGKYVIIAERINGDRLYETTFEVKKTLFDGGREITLIEINKNVLSQGNAGISIGNSLYLVPLATSLLVIYLIYRKKKMIRDLEVDEDLDDL